MQVLSYRTPAGETFGSTGTDSGFAGESSFWVNVSFFGHVGVGQQTMEDAAMRSLMGIEAKLYVSLANSCASPHRAVSLELAVHLTI